MSQKQQVFTAKDGEQLIVRYRRAGVFFERVADINKPNAIAAQNSRNQFFAIHEQYVCESELKRRYEFDHNEFKRLYDYCCKISHLAWDEFTPKEVENLRSDYSECYHPKFGNESNLYIGDCFINTNGPYTQLKSDGPIVCLVQFSRRRFESFMHDFNEAIKR